MLVCINYTVFTLKHLFNFMYNKIAAFVMHIKYSFLTFCIIYKWTSIKLEFKINVYTLSIKSYNIYTVTKYIYMHVAKKNHNNNSNNHTNYA